MRRWLLVLAYLLLVRVGHGLHRARHPVPPRVEGAEPGLLRVFERPAPSCAEVPRTRCA